jgi:PAB-dependent poly(A)-specific ribonuclease subunit 3
MGNSSNSSSKKGLNVDSPSFTPSLLSSNDTSSKKTTTISPKAASAAPFLPKNVTSRSNTSTPSIRQETATPDWSVSEIQDFVPQSFDASQVASLQGNSNGVLASAGPYDPFVTPPTPLATTGSVTHQLQSSPFSHDATALGGAAFFSSQTNFQQPVQYHLYAPIGPHSQNIMGYQRNVHDLFLPNNFREELQKKAAATLQTLPSV